jgi:DNA-binding response OmpR family regulator
MKILLADDDAIALAMVKKVLAKENHEVLLCEDGEAALALIRHGGIRLVISDWNMPKMDGIDLCQQLRKTDGLAYVYLIMMTSRDTKDEMMVGLWAGADDFITKPIDPKELLLRVRKGERVINEFQASEAKCTAFQECLAEMVSPQPR